MKIFIVYASAGAGHRKAAEAIYDTFKNKTPAEDIRLIDILEKTNFLFRNTYAGGYRLLVHYAPWLWSWLFKLTSIKCIRALTAATIAFFDILSSRRFSRLIIREQPDIVISTHFMPPEVLSHLKRSNKIKSRLVTVITDFGVHPLWVRRGTDVYIVASSLSKKYLLEAGADVRDIWELGIPIDKKFARSYDKIEERKKLGLAPDKFTLLITTGSFGIGPVAEVAAALHKQVQIIVVCAKNNKLYRNLREMALPNTKVFGFIDNIHELMAACDVAIIKPGGLTTSEILSMELVPVFITPIPGQEVHNLIIMQEFGIGKYASGIKGISEAVLAYRNDPARIIQERETIKKIKKPFSAEDIYNALR